MAWTDETTCSDLLALIVCLAIMGLAPASLSVEWTDYDVSESLLEKAMLWNATGLRELHETWPHLFYHRDVQLHQICFPRLNETICKHTI